MRDTGEKRRPILAKEGKILDAAVPIENAVGMISETAEHLIGQTEALMRFIKHNDGDIRLIRTQGSECGTHRLHPISCRVFCPETT